MMRSAHFPDIREGPDVREALNLTWYCKLATILGLPAYQSGPGCVSTCGALHCFALVCVMVLI